MDKTKVALAALGLSLVLFFAVNIVSSATLRSWRLDLTEDGLYSLTDGTRNVLANIDEPIHLYLYYSEKAASEEPGLKQYGTRVRETLEEYALASGGKLRLTVIDPEPFSEEEDEAAQAGIVPIGSGEEPLYFGLVGRSAGEKQEVIPFFNPGKESFLEYDLTNLIYGLDLTAPPKIGLLSSLPMDGGMPESPNPMAPPQGATPQWQVLAQLERLYEVERIDSYAQSIPAEIDVLLVVHPKRLGEPTLYAIDQFVLGGGHVLVFVDPWCEADRPAPDPMNPMAGMDEQRDSSLERLFTAWGLELEPGTVAADRKLATGVDVGGRKPVPYVVWLTVTGDECFNRDEATTGQLGRVLMPTPGALRARDGATTELTPLVTTTEEAMHLEATRLMLPDPQALLAGYFPEGAALTLAARVTGTVQSAFPDGPPAGWEAPAAPPTSPPTSIGETQPASTHRSASDGPIQLIAVADADFLQDQWWIREEQFMGLSLGYRRMFDNGDFVLNAVEQLAGNDDLISIRGRGLSARPFKRVDAIRADAEQAFLVEQQMFETELRATEQKLADLQRSAPGDDALILTPAQQTEIDKLRLQERETRKKLRDVQHQKQQDIERLGASLKWLNAVVVPGIVALAAAFLGVWRVQQRRAAQPVAGAK